MRVSRQDLIEICDNFLKSNIGSKDVEAFAWNLITSDNHEWNDDVIDEIIFQWDNEEINFPINKVNIQLWKKRLITDIDELPEYNIWNIHIAKQQAICEKHHSNWMPIDKKSVIKISGDLQNYPIQGQRHSTNTETSGWVIWTGINSKAKNSYNLIIAEQLLQIKPQIIKFLGLKTGSSFRIDKSGLENVFFSRK